jgi:hypothetical protein
VLGPYAPADGESDADIGRRHTETFLQLLKGEGFARPNPSPMFANPPGLLRIEPHSEKPARAHLVGLGLKCHRRVGSAAGHESAEIDIEAGRNWGALPRSASRADPRL